MQIFKNITELQHWRDAQKKLSKTVALVPTMGNLHAGHLSLVTLAKENADHCLVSIFVNPTQFGPNEDFDAYPRTLTEDLAQLTEAGADAVFAPSSPNILYSDISIPIQAPMAISNRLCGKYRPGHFDGVLQVVNKLLNLCGPNIAIFGEKDYQQLLLIRLMVKDFFLPIKIIGGPLMRDESGLAMSSRNRYLSPDQKALASQLFQHLTQTEKSIQAGSLTTSAQMASHCKAQITSLNKLGFEMQYYEICDAQTLSPLSEPGNSTPDNTTLIHNSNPPVILAAGYLGKTRLIDNIQVTYSG